MENTETKAMNAAEIQGIAGMSDFIKNFFSDLTASKDFASLKDAPFASPEARSNLFAYLNMGVIEAYLRKLKAQTLGEVDTFMSNGLQWVNGTVSRNENVVKDADARELIHLYVNLLALLAGAPTIFMKIGALTMYSIAPDSTANW